jgi:hypothetical protein
MLDVRYIFDTCTLIDITNDEEELLIGAQWLQLRW